MRFVHRFRATEAPCRRGTPPPPPQIVRGGARVCGLVQFAMGWISQAASCSVCWGNMTAFG